jgi:hypothetical protein
LNFSSDVVLIIALQVLPSGLVPIRSSPPRLLDGERGILFFVCRPVRFILYPIERPQITTSSWYGPTRGKARRLLRRPRRASSADDDGSGYVRVVFSWPPPMCVCGGSMQQRHDHKTHGSEIEEPVRPQRGGRTSSSVHSTRKSFVC